MSEVQIFHCKEAYYIKVLVGQRIKEAKYNCFKCMIDHTWKDAMKKSEKIEFRFDIAQNCSGYTELLSETCIFDICKECISSIVSILVSWTHFWPLNFLDFLVNSYLLFNFFLLKQYLIPSNAISNTECFLCFILF